MSLATILDRVRSVRQKKTVDIQSRYLELVRELAAGSEVDADELATILDALDKSDDGLQADVDRYAERVVLSQRLTQAKSMEAERIALEPKLAALVAERDEAYRAFELKIQPLRERANFLSNHSGSVQTAIENLKSTVQDPSILSENQAIAARRKEVMDARQYIIERNVIKNQGLRVAHLEYLESIDVKQLQQEKPQAAQDHRRALAAARAEVAASADLATQHASQVADCDSEMRDLERQRYRSNGRDD